MLHSGFRQGLVFWGELLAWSAWNNVAIVLQHVGFMKKDAADFRFTATMMTWMTAPWYQPEACPGNSCFLIVSGFFYVWKHCLASWLLLEESLEMNKIYMKYEGQRRDGTSSFLMWMSYDFHYARSIYLFIFSILLCML